MLAEQKNLHRSRPHERPPAFGYTLLFRPTDAADFLHRFRSVWGVVASWGRFSDEELGAWPNREECLDALPDPFSTKLQDERPVDIDGWLDDIHDRDWVVWSTAVVDAEVKIDLDANSMPISTWPVRLVADILGADLVYANSWRG